MAGEIVAGEVLWVLGIGLIGGFVHDALQGGFTLPWMDNSPPPAFKPGFIGDLIVGAGAAFVTYASTIATATSTTPLQLAVLAFTSGIGGSAILMSYVNGKKLAEYKERLINLKALP